MTNIKKHNSFLFLFAAILLLASSCASSEKKSKVAPADELYGKALNFYLKGFYESSETELLTLLNEHPLSSYAKEAQLLLANNYYESEKYDEAASYYATFHAIHPSHSKASYALFQKAMSHFKQVLTADRDQSETKKALFAFEDFLNVYPSGLYTARAVELIGFLNDRLAQNEFYVGKFYYKDENFEGALFRFGELIRLYPKAKVIDKTLYFVGKSYLELGEDDLAKETFENLINAFPESPYAGDAKTELDS